MQTLSEICLLAAQICKGGSNMVGIAGQMLNLELEELKLVRNLKMNRVTQPLTVTTGTFGPFALEADYLRSYDATYPLQGPNGMTQFLTHITMEQWDEEFKGSQTANYPYEYATDTSTQAQVWSGGTAGQGTMTSAGQLWIYPQSNGSISITHRYFVNQPDYVNPQTSNNFPWFPNTSYLVDKVAMKMMGMTGDTRRAEFFKQCEAMLAPYLIMQGDEMDTVRTIRLDPRHFKSNRGLKPTKVNPF